MAQLKAVIDSLESVHESLREFYKQQGTKYVLQADGFYTEEEYNAVGNRVKEFRENNIRLERENGELKEAYKGIDPATVRSQLGEYEKLKQQGVGKSDDLAATVAKAVDAAVAPLKAKLDDTEKREVEARTRVERQERESLLWTQGEKAGVEPWAKDMFLAKAGSVFDVKDGQLVPKDQNMYSKRKGAAGQLVTADEYFKEWLPAEAPGIYKRSEGSGEPPSKQAGAIINDGRTRVIPNDAEAVSRNLEGLASGKVVVGA